MSTEASGDPAAVAKTTSKSSKKKAPAKVKSQHPTYREMVAAALGALKERKGVSRQAVIEYIKNNFKVRENCENHIKGALVKGVVGKALVQTSGKGASGRFKLAVVVKPKKAAPKKVVKKAPKKAVKKSVAKKAKPASKKVTKKAIKKKPVKKTASKVVKSKPKVKKTAVKKTSVKKTFAKKPSSKRVSKK